MSKSQDGLKARRPDGQKSEVQKFDVQKTKGQKSEVLKSEDQKCPKSYTYYKTYYEKWVANATPATHLMSSLLLG